MIKCSEILIRLIGRAAARRANVSTWDQGLNLFPRWLSLGVIRNDSSAYGRLQFIALRGFARFPC